MYGILQPVRQIAKIFCKNIYSQGRYLLLYQQAEGRE